MTSQDTPELVERVARAIEPGIRMDGPAPASQQKAMRVWEAMIAAALEPRR